ncbi:MAG: CAP domain-containing protein [Oscillochloris sp.]|nr:CAP domain-containing protein [Oscillochloris sp.]
MHRTRLTPIVLTVTILTIATLLGLRQPIQAADPATTTTLYLPSLVCDDCALPQPTPFPPPMPADLATFRAEVIRLINIERANDGCPSPVVSNDKLMAATQGWAEEAIVRGGLTHAPASWYEQYGYPGGLENIAGGAMIEYPAYSIEAFWTSPTHRGNLLACWYTNDPTSPNYFPNTIYEIGVGIADGYLVITIGYGTK